MSDMHLVIFLAKKYQPECRTSTNRTESVERCDTHIVIFFWSMNINQPSATHLRFEHKHAFSRFSQNCEPLIVVEIFGKIVKRQVCKKGGELPTADTNPISHIDQPNRISRDVRYASCDFFWPINTNTISHIDPPNRIGRDVRYASCDFYGQENTNPNIAHRPAVGN